MKHLIILSICFCISVAAKEFHISPEKFSSIKDLKIQPGDQVFLESSVFKGKIELQNIKATWTNPVTITSNSANPAIISSNTDSAIDIKNSSGIIISNIIVKGSGRETNNNSGVIFRDCEQVIIQNVVASGYVWSGIDVKGGNRIKILGCHAYENGFCGIHVTSHKMKKNVHDVYIARCVAENNPGCRLAKNNHSGNGILVAGVVNCIIEHCEAMNNGWDMPRKGNGPVGIWGWNCDRLVIQYCIAHHNRTSPKGGDGGGFDLDGGATNSIMQYNLSYENEGCGYGLFQFKYATEWKNNIVRYNISYNDGKKNGQAGIYVWTANDTMSHCEIYNNTIINDYGYAVGYILERPLKKFRFFNNIFIAKTQDAKFVTAYADNFSDTVFDNNLYWSHILQQKNEPQPQVTIDSKAYQQDPRIVFPTSVKVFAKLQPRTIIFGQLLDDSPCGNLGIAHDGQFDYFGNMVPTKNISLGFHQLTK